MGILSCVEYYLCVSHQNRQRNRLFKPQFLLLTLLLLVSVSSIAFGATTTASCNFSTSKQNLWGGDSAYAYQKNLTLFEVPLDVDTTRLTNNFRPVVTILGDDYGADLGAKVNARVGMYFNLDATAGEIDVQYGGAVKFEYPDPRTFVKGATFTIRTSIDENVKHIVTRSPRVVTDLYLAGYISLEAYYKFILQSNDYPVFNLKFDSRDFADPLSPYYTINGTTGNMGFSLFKLDSGTSSQPAYVKVFYPSKYNLLNGGYITEGLPYPVPDDITEKTNISGEFNLPHVELDDDFQKGPSDPGLLKASGEDVFIELSMDLDAWLPIPKPYELLIRGEYKNDFMGVGYGASYDILNVELGFNVSEVQDFEFRPVVSTSLAFSSPLNVCVTEASVEVPPASNNSCWKMNQTGVTLAVGQNLHINYPSGIEVPKAVTVTPSFALTQTSFKNKTSLHFEEPLTFEFLKAEAHIDGFELVPEICIPAVTVYACWPFDCGDVTITPEVCTPSVGFDGLQYEVGPAWDYTLSTGLQNQNLTVYEKNWSLGGFTPATITDSSSVFEMESGEPPTVSDATLSITEEQAGQGRFVTTPIIDNKQTFRIISQGTKGKVVITNTVTGDYIYTPNPDAYGTDTFTFKVHNNNPLFNVDSNLGTVTVTIANVNDAPRDITISKDHVAQASATGTVVATLTAVDPDLPDHDSHTFTLTDSAGGRFRIVGNQLQVDNGSLLNYATATQHNISVRVSDTTGATFNKTLTLNVKSIPVASAGTLSVTEDFAKTGTLAATDQDGEAQTYSVVTNSLKGTVTITNTTTGAYTYTPLRNANGSDSFTVRATDASGYQSNIATVSVTIASVNDPILDLAVNPAISSTTSFETTKDSWGTEMYLARTSGDYIAYLMRSTSGLQNISIFKREADGTLTNQTIASPPAYITDFSISGDYAVFVLSQHVSIYKRNSGDGIWRQETILTPPDGAAYIKYAAVSGDTIIASDFFRGIYFCQRNSSSGAWEWKQTVSKGGEETDYFIGASVAISGNVAAVGLKAYATKETTINNKLYIYEKDGNGTWNKKATMQSDHAATDGFGLNLALNGSVAVTGAPADREKGQKAGAAYLLERFDDGSWKATRLTAADGQASDAFGTSVSFLDNTLAIGAPGKSVMGRTGAGSVYIFKRNQDGSLIEKRKIVPPTTRYPLTRFGSLATVMSNYHDMVVTGSYKIGIQNYVLLVRTSSEPVVSVNEGVDHGGRTGAVVGGSATGTPVGTLVPFDFDLDNPDAIGTYTFTLLENAGGRFKLTGNEIQVDNAGLLDFENSNNHAIRVRAADSHGSSIEKLFRIYVNNFSEIPSADDKSFTTQEDTPLSGTLTGSDLNNNTLTYKIAGSPKKGTVSLNSVTGAFSYTPYSNITGTDTFTYKVHNGLVDSPAATVSIQITSLNDTPVGIGALTGVTLLNDPAGAAGDLYGSSVAVSGNYAVIGAKHNSESSSKSGAAVFIEKGTNGSWQQVLKVKPDSQADAFTGAAVAISDTYAIIGAYGHDKNGAPDSGIAYIYQRADNIWSYAAAFDPAESSGADHTGLSVGISGSYAIAGAPGASVNGSNAGAAYILERDANGWKTPDRLLPTDGAAGDLFGTAVAISGSYAIIGAPGDADKGGYSGSAYIFERNASTGIWEQKAKLLAADGTAGSTFGTAVAISGSDAVVGASNHVTYGMARSGAAYVFKRAADGTWSQTDRLITPDGAPEDELGAAVAISGDLIAAGAPKDGDKGSVHLFQRGGDGKWSQVQRITANDGATGDDFGGAVSLSGTKLLAGASLADVNGKADVGKAYLFVAGNLSVQENAPVNTVVGQLTVSDVDEDDTYTYVLLNDAGGRFKISGSQLLVANSTLLDYETAASHDIRVKAIDSSGATFEKVFTVIITDANEAPVTRNDVLFTNKNTAQTSALYSIDPENSALAYSIVTNGAYGTAEILDAATGSYRYTPNTDFTGTDTFTFITSDGVNNSNTSTITVYVATDVNEALLAYYPFNGNANDSSGNNRHGAVNGPALTADRSGGADGAYQFNWNNISIPSFKFGGAFSFTAWIRNDRYINPSQSSMPGSSQKLLDFSGGGTNYVSIGLDGNSNLTFDIAGDKLTSSATVPRYTWTHVAVTHLNGNVNFYLNGTLAGSGTISAPLLDTTRSSHLLGSYFVGALDEIRLYNRLLTATDVRYVSAVPSCGASNHAILTSEPTANLCSEGVASAVTGNGPWSWSCKGPATSAACTAYRPVNGTCSSYNGMSLDTVPAVLCASGTASAVSGNGPWAWTCNGAYTGITASCAATINTYPLTISKASSGTGSVTASSGALNWSGNIATATYNAGTNVSLSAIAGENSVFVGWSGACSGTGTCSVTMSAATNVVAAFVNKNSGLLAYYPFNGSANDASGNGRHATVFGVSSSGDISGIPDSAYSFDGISNYLTIPSFDLGGPFSLSAWVYLNSATPDWQRLIDFGNGQWDNNLVVGIQGQKMFIESYSGNSSSKIYTTDTFPQNQWVHVAATIDVSGNGKIYWNGALKGSGKTYLPPVLSRSYQYIGRSNWPDPYFGGKMDEIRLYNRAIDENEVKALYQINGACGDSNGANLTAIPATGFCREGVASAVSGSGPWSWSCTGANGGGSASCGANLLVNGTCGTASGQTFTTVPQTNLCATGAVSPITGSGPWSWTCQGANTGTDAGCSANIQTYSVTITKSGTGTGTIIDNSGGLIIWNGSIGTGTIKYGTNLLLTAKMDPGSVLKSWNGSLNDSETYQVTVDSAKNIAVEFTTATLDDGLLVHFPFSGNANDISGNGYNGVVSGAIPGADRFGNTNKAYSFPARGTYINVAPGQTLPVVNSLSISLWFRTDSDIDYYNKPYLISKGYVEFAGQTIPGPFAIGMSRAGRYEIFGKGQGLSAYGAFADNEWTHLAVVYSGTTATVYENGVQIGQGTVGAVNDMLANTTSFTDGEFFVGMGARDPWLNTRWDGFKGSIDDVRVYRRALSSTEVEQLRLLNTSVLTITKSATGSGAVTGTPGTIKWSGATGKAYYDPANSTVVTLTATPDSGSVFTGWSGACSGAGSCVVTMSASRDVTATFMYPTDGLIAHYPFNGNANDAGGNGYNGTVYGATATTDRFGNANNALSFDGSGNYISLPPFPVGGPFSLSAWVYLNSNTTDWQRVIDFGYGQWNNNLVVGIQGKKMFIEGYNGDASIKVYTTEEFPQGQWVHLLASIDGSGTANIYWNGVPKGSGTTYVPPLIARPNQYIGKSNWPDPYWGGKMDDLRLYNRALHPQEAVALSTHLLTVTKPGSGIGSVTSNKGTLQWNGTTGTATILSGEVVTLTATPDGSATFTGWTGACSGTGTCVITMDGAKTVGAVFTHDIIPPTGSIAINSGGAITNTPAVTLSLTCTDTDTGCAQMQFSNDNVTWSTPEAYAASKIWNTGEPKMKPVIISNFQPDFQTSMTVTYDTDMRGDFSDLRFIDTTTQQNIPYWIESKTDGVSATVWVKTGASNTIVMTYGTSNVSSTGDANSVFELYDHFDSGTTDQAKWKLVNYSYYSYAYAYNLSSMLNVTVYNGDYWGTDDTSGYLVSNAALPANFVVETLVSTLIPRTYTRFFSLRSGQETNAKTFFMLRNGSSNITNGYRDTVGGSADWYGESSGISYPGNGKIAKFVVVGDTASSYYDNQFMNSRTVPGWGLKYVAFTSSGDISSSQPNKFDWIRVRKYAAVEPTVTFASEQAWTSYVGMSTRNIYVKFSDDAGNWSNAYNASIQLDMAGPTVTPSPAGGIYPSAQNVTLTCSDSGGTGCTSIYYTINGSTPTGNSIRYTDPIPVSAHTVLKFFAMDTAGNSGAVHTEVYSFNLLSGSVQKGELTVEPAMVTTLAGQAGSAATVDAVGAAARFNSPVGITTDGENLYTTGYSDHTIRKIVIATGQVSTVAGLANNPGSGDGTGTAARFNTPWDITTDGANLYVADSANHTIRKIVIDTGVVTTLAGLAGNAGSSDGSGSVARFRNPRGITNDGTNLYVVDAENHTLRKIVIASGTVSTIAGTAGSSGSTDNTGAAARFNWPLFVTTDGQNLYVTESSNHAIRKVVLATGTVSTIAGTVGTAGAADGTATAAQFNVPFGIVTDGTNLYMSDQLNHAVRKIEIATGKVLTIAGALGTSGAADGTGWDARFSWPCGITSDGTNLYVAEFMNHTIRKIAAGTDTRTNGLIAYYPFNGNANDASGNNRNGTVYGSALTTDRFGNANSAYSFDGLGNYISLPTFQIGGAFSLGAWVYLNSNDPDWQRIIDFGNGAENHNLVVGIDNNRKMFVVGDTAPNISTSEDFPTGQWVHVAATIDGSSGSVKIYWNGVLKGSGTTSVPPLISRTNQFIGKSNWAVDAYFGGRMDDLRLYNRVLSLSDIEALYTYDNGVCGSANNQTVAAVPTANLCSAGTASAVTVNGGALAWSCSGTNGGADANCGASLIINGACGASSGQSFDMKPATALCGAGTASEVTGNGPWNWSCSGYNGGAPVDCSATINSYTLTVSKSGTGASGGVVTADSGVLNWSANSSTASYSYGTTVMLTATSSAGSTFTGWSGACSGKGTCTVTVDGVKNVTARFSDFTSGLLAYYPFHGDANDVSGNGRHATVNGATAVPEGDNANILTYEFNPMTYDQNNNEKYITLPSFQIGGAFSMSAWIKADVYQTLDQYHPQLNWQRIIDFGNGQQDSIIVAILSGHLRAEARIGSGSSAGVSAPLATHTRTHVAVTVDASGFMKMYLNGQLKASGQSVALPTTSRTNQYIGKSNWTSDPYLHGRVDELRLYSKVLADTEIEDLAGGRDALCGSSNGQRLTVRPESGLCSQGTASPVTGTGPWSWTCISDKAGGDVECSAARAYTQTITFNPATVAYGSPSLDLGTYATGGASGNPVTFSLVSGPGMLSGVNNATLTVTGIGTIVVKASQAGNTDYLDAPAVQQTITVAKAGATVTLSGLNQPYNGSARPVTVTTIPANRNVTVTYNGSATVPSAIGSYNVVATVTDASYQGTASGTLVIGKGEVAITLDGLSQIYNGAPKPVTAITTPAGTAVSLTYNGSVTAPTAAGSYTVNATVTDANYQGTASGTLVIAKMPVQMTFGNLSQVYDGTAKAATITTIPSGKIVTVTYNGSATAPVTAGSYAVTATVVDDNYVGTVTDTLVIAKAPATLTLGSLSATYDGTAKPVTYTVEPSGKTVVVTYNDSVTVPVNAGTYSVIAAVDDPNYAGTVYGSLIITKQTASVSISNLSYTYDGTAKTVTTVTSPEGLPVTVTYKGSATAPSNAGSYAVVATINDVNYKGSTSDTMIIGKATAAITLGNLLVSYDGSQKTATATTLPAGKTVTFAYNGLSTPPSNIGSYAVTAIITDNNYQGSASGTLQITDQPVVLSLAASPRSSGLTADITSFTGSASFGITGYCLSETNAGSGCVWSSTVPSSYTFATAGVKTLYGFIKDTSGTISSPYGPVNVTISRRLTVQVAANGTLVSGVGGTVTSNPSGISCINSVKGTVVACENSFTGAVSLSATPSILSTFSGWGGGFCSGTGVCSLTMDGDKSVTATFNQAALARIVNTDYATMQDAYNSAATDAIIKLLATNVGVLTINRNVNLTLKGGYEGTYSSNNAGVTTIDQPLIIKQGRITVERLVIK